MVVTASAPFGGTPTFPATVPPSQLSLFDAYKNGVLNATDLLFFDVTGDGLITAADQTALQTRMSRFVGALPLPAETPPLTPPPPAP